MIGRLGIAIDLGIFVGPALVNAVIEGKSAEEFKSHGIGAVLSAFTGSSLGAIKTEDVLNELSSGLISGLSGDGFSLEGHLRSPARIPGSYPGEYGYTNTLDVISETMPVEPVPVSPSANVATPLRVGGTGAHA